MNGALYIERHINKRITGFYLVPANYVTVYNQNTTQPQVLSGLHLMIWIKALHLIFMVAWFAGLFYLPRLFVNHAMADEEAVRQRLGLMESKLYRFITPWMVLTLVFGSWLLIDYAWQAYALMYWLKIKLALIACLVLYHFYCGKIIRELANNSSQRSHIWFRWFNEFPVLILFAVVILAVVKPF